MLKEYYQLTKPGIIYGNVLTTIAGFMLASRGHISWGLFAATVAGTALVIASACVFNNFIDQDIDSLMARTKSRALASAKIEEEYALIYGSVLGLAGIAILSVWTNRLTVLVGLLGFVSYVWWYTSLKRKTVHATLVGSIPGATPIVAGYVAVTGHLDLGAILLFAIMVVWQMPHFYAISMFRCDDYANAKVPVLAVVKGMRTSAKYIFWYVLAFAVVVALLALYGYASFSFFVVMAIISFYWIWIGKRGFKKGNDNLKWARKMFGTSLLVLLVLSVMLSLDAWLP
jgi:protoheme IX farnesyltransferase